MLWVLGEESCIEISFLCCRSLLAIGRAGSWQKLRMEVAQHDLVKGRVSFPALLTGSCCPSQKPGPDTVGIPLFTSH